MLGLAAWSNRHSLQARDALGQRRMSAEKTAEQFATREWGNDAKSWGGGGNIHGYLFGLSPELFKRANQPIGMADHLGAGCVRLIFPLPRNSELKKKGRERCKKQHQKSGNPTSTAIAISPAAHP